MGEVTWIVGPDTFQRNLHMRKVVGTRLVEEIETPSTRFEVDSFVRRGSLIPTVKVLRDPSKFTRQDDYPAVLAGYPSDLVILSEESFYQLSGAFYKALAKVAEVKRCEFLKEYTEDLLNFVIQHAVENGVTLSTVTADMIIDACGADLWHIDAEIRKLAYVSSCPATDLVEQLVFYGGGYTVDAGDLVRGNWQRFISRALSVEPFQLIWRLIDYYVRILEFHQIFNQKGTLAGSRIQPRMVPKYESELRQCPEHKTLLMLTTLSRLLMNLHTTDSRAFIYRYIISAATS